ATLEGSIQYASGIVPSAVSDSARSQYWFSSTVSMVTEMCGFSAVKASKDSSYASSAPMSQIRNVSSTGSGAVVASVVSSPFGAEEQAPMSRATAVNAAKNFRVIGPPL